MFKDTLMMRVLCDKGFQPSGSIGPWSYVFVLTSIPYMLSKTGVVCNIGDDSVDSASTVLCSDRFSTSTQFDETLEKDLNHIVDARFGCDGNVLDEMTAVSGDRSTKRVDRLQDAFK